MGAKAKTAEEKARNDSAEFKISNQIFKRRVKKTKRSIIQSSKKISWNTTLFFSFFFWKTTLLRTFPSLRLNGGKKEMRESEKKERRVMFY